tara:strand:- start:1037 stop:1195 length:159 start_codon:yes stop_codon:yes gene_type:complete
MAAFGITTLIDRTEQAFSDLSCLFGDSADQLIGNLCRVWHAREKPSYIKHII